MKRIIVICEGETEQRFCKQVLIPYFLTKGIFIQYPTIKKSGGGIVAWPSLLKQIEEHLKKDRESIVTTFIDYYGINDRHLFPSWVAANKIADKNNRLQSIESSMKNDLHENLRHRFLPYVQLHEFEGLLFNNIRVFRKRFSDKVANFEKLENIINNNPNPESINDGKDSAPSIRLENLIEGYDKVIDGAILAHEIGLANIRSKCPRFNAWIETLESQ
jgi:hypothetical protein